MSDTRSATDTIDPRATLGMRDEAAAYQQRAGGWDPSVRILPWGEWMDEGVRRFGPNKLDWVFRCPACGRKQSARDFVKLGVDPTGVVFKVCIGRYKPPSSDPWVQPCRCTLDALVRFPRVVVLYQDSEMPVFEYADGPSKG